MTPSDYPVPDVPIDFVDRVMVDVHRERAKIRARRAMGAAIVCAAAIAMFAWGFVARQNRGLEGDVVAETRTEIDVGPGVRAVLERAAHIAWTTAGITQDRGDVFYRLAPGAHVNIHTPVGDIGSEAGTCSRVRVDAPPSPDGATNAANADSGSPVVFVAVSSGAVAVRRDGHDVRLAAGQYARVDAQAIRTDADDDDGAIAYAFVPERARVYARKEPPPMPTAEPIAELIAKAPATPKSAPRASSKAPPPGVSASAMPTASPPRVYLAPPCVCSPLTPICDCNP